MQNRNTGAQGNMKKMLYRNAEMRECGTQRKNQGTQARENAKVHRNVCPSLLIEAPESARKTLQDRESGRKIRALSNSPKFTISMYVVHGNPNFRLIFPFFLYLFLGVPLPCQLFCLLLQVHYIDLSIFLNSFWHNSLKK